MNVCVFCSSSNALSDTYYQVANDLGRRIGERQWTLIFGGGQVGLMGILATAVQQHGGNVVAVIPYSLNRAGIVYETANELIITPDLRQRKAIMDERSQAFIALPGGFGTAEELLEVITLKQLGYHVKPVVMINTAGFYNALLEFFERLYADRFTNPQYRQLYFIANSVDDALAYIDSYQPKSLPEKWYLED